MRAIDLGTGFDGWPTYIVGYDTREEAQAEADRLNREQYNTPYGAPMLDHGQADPDHHSARKIRGVRAFGVWVETNYYGGTFNAPKSHWLPYSGV